VGGGNSDINTQVGATLPLSDSGVGLFGLLSYLAIGTILDDVLTCPSGREVHLVPESMVSPRFATSVANAVREVEGVISKQGLATFATGDRAITQHLAKDVVNNVKPPPVGHAVVLR
jgi:hypothetical protein